MPLARVVEPEILDCLPAEDPRAIQSRRDLRRINTLMLNDRTMARLLAWCFAARAAPRLMIECGGGDGSFIAAVARKMCRKWPGVTVISVDRKNAADPRSVREIAGLGWTLQCVSADIFDFFAHYDGPRADAVMANLFLHHFPGPELARLISAALSRTDAFVACEPRRTWPALLASRLLFALGVNAVTRHDAVVSVRAGFRDWELSGLIATSAQWTVYERSAFPFTHYLAARRDGRGAFHV